MTISELCKEAHDCAVEKGFWGEDGKKNRNISELLMLIVTELGEACEALRKNNRQIYLKDIGKEYTGTIKAPKNLRVVYNWQKDTFEDEISDVFIRLGDLCEALNIDIEWQIKNKMKYNKKREFLHGKKF